MRKAVIVSLDAFFDADFDSLTPGGGLDRMLREGSFCRSVKTVFPALTYPAHVTLATGCDPDRSGVGQNQPYQPGVASASRAWYWERKYIQVPTLFDAVSEAGGKSCSVLWPVNCRSKTVRWCFPEVHTLPGENQILKILRFGTPSFILKAETHFSKLRDGISEPGLSDYAAALTRYAIRKYRPDLTAVHLIDLDEMRHHHGVFSAEAKDAIRRNERRLKEIADAMKHTRGMEDALLIAVSDHGQADITKTVNLTEMLKECGLTGKAGVQSNGFSAYFFIGNENGDEIPKIMAILREKQEMYGIRRFYTREEMNAMHAVSGPAFACEAADGVVFSDALDAVKREKATHGFGPGHCAENCLFAVYGNGIRKGYELGSMPMRDVAPTVAGLMGLRLTEASGTDHSAEITDK